MSIVKKWMKEGKIVFAKYNTTDGLLKKIKVIEKVHTNTVIFKSGDSHDVNYIEQVAQWIPIEQYHPVKESLFLNKSNDWCLGYYDPDTNTCENEHELMENITHFMPKIELDK